MPNGFVPLFVPVPVWIYVLSPAFPVGSPSQTPASLLPPLGYFLSAYSIYPNQVPFSTSQSDARPQAEPNCPEPETHNPIQVKINPRKSANLSDNSKIPKIAKPERAGVKRVYIPAGAMDTTKEDVRATGDQKRMPECRVANAHTESLCTKSPPTKSTQLSSEGAPDQLTSPVNGKRIEDGIERGICSQTAAAGRVMEAQVLGRGSYMRERVRAEPVGSWLWLRPAARRLRVDLLSPQSAQTAEAAETAEKGSVAVQSRAPEMRRVLASKLEESEEISNTVNAAEGAVEKTGEESRAS